MENEKRLQELREERSRILGELNDINNKIESAKNEMYKLEDIPVGKLIRFSCGMGDCDAVGIVNSYYMFGNDSKWLALVGRFVVYPSDGIDHTFPEYACRIEIALNDIGWFKESIKEIGDVDRIYDIVIGKVKESLENELLTD